jgi:N-acetylmuramic acid 6-phosphate etherase
MDLDRLSTAEIVRRINGEDTRVPGAVRRVLPEVAQAVDLITRALRGGGRLIYVGAGTSGRLGVLDAAECPPTFGTDPGLVRGVVAGGEPALVRAIEGAEDRDDEGRRAIDALQIGPKDVVVGVAASWRTPYTLAAVGRARELGARTVYLTTNPRERVEVVVDVLIAPEVGPEVIMGSTRMKSATAQKMVMNMLTTATMVHLGKVYENMMVDLMATSEKLRERSKRVVMLATGLSYDDAERALEGAGGSVKRAIVMKLGPADFARADQALAGADGHVRDALDALGRRGNEPQARG